MHLFLKKDMKTQPKHPGCKKNCGQDLKKGCDEKDVNQKAWLLITLKFCDNDDPGCKTLRLLGHYFNVINSIPAQALTAPF